MKPLEINFAANSERGGVSWKMWGKCANIDQLRAFKAALTAYMDMKIAEAESEAPNV